MVGQYPIGGNWTIIRQWGIIVWNAFAQNSRSSILGILETLSNVETWIMLYIPDDHTLHSRANIFSKIYSGFPGHRFLLIFHKSKLLGWGIMRLKAISCIIRKTILWQKADRGQRADQFVISLTMLRCSANWSDHRVVYGCLTK